MEGDTARPLLVGDGRSGIADTDTRVDGSVHVKASIVARKDTHPTGQVDTGVDMDAPANAASNAVGGYYSKYGAPDQARGPDPRLGNLPGYAGQHVHMAAGQRMAAGPAHYHVPHVVGDTPMVTIPAHEYAEMARLR